MVEYWLLKKQLGGWTKISWWSEDEKDKAERSYKSLAVHNSGYAWRLVKVETIEEMLLDDMTEEAKVEPETLDVRDYGAVPDPVVNVWGTPHAEIKTGQAVGNEFPNKEHGLAGSVWLVHHGLKKKTRVAASEVDSLIAQGYERGSPRTEFRG